MDFDKETSFAISRRTLLAGAAGLMTAAALPIGPRPALAAGKVLRTETWGELVELAEGVWAVVSTPLKSRDFKTVCNGGIVAGSERVLVIESFGSTEGARWVGEAALELTGRWPTDVVITHYHGDHAAGLGGLARDGEQPRVLSTPTTLARLDGGGTESPEAAARGQMLSRAERLDENEPLELGLGGSSALLRPWTGHTASDVTVDVEGKGIVFGGDLVWNQMIPNFVDATPTDLRATLEGLVSTRQKTYVPGHGPLAEGGVLEHNLAILSATEEVARRSFEAGTEPAAAAKEVKLPGELAEWGMFRPTYIDMVITAWYHELAG
jgi:cyclase